MPVSLAKGQRISLEKVAPGLSAISVGLGWDRKVTDRGYDFDLDSSLFLLGNKEKLISDQHCVFYDNLTIPDDAKSGQHLGDNLNGVEEGDIVNASNQQAVVRYDLTKDYSIETALIMTELYRKNEEWRVNAVGAGYQGGLQALLDRYQS